MQALLPLTPAVFHILPALADADQHGYAIAREVAEQTRGAVRLGPGTLYGTLGRVVDAGLVEERPSRKGARQGPARPGAISPVAPRPWPLRLALGARPGHIISQVVRQGLAVALVGLVAGLGAALAVSSLSRAQLYEISPTDPATFAVVAVVLALTAVAATSVPARRASRVDALVALKTD